MFPCEASTGMFSLSFRSLSEVSTGSEIRFITPIQYSRSELACSGVPAATCTGEAAARTVPCRKARREEFTADPTISVDGDMQSAVIPALQSEHVRNGRARSNPYEI